MNRSFVEALKARRSYYVINNEKVISDERIEEIVREAVKYTPSSFNSQSARAVLLLSEQHNRFWDITMEALRKVVPADAFSSTEERILSFKNGYGTVLYFEDQSVIRSLQEQYGLYKDNFPIWSQHSSGMLQLALWTALEDAGFGASLQHYTELIEADAKKEWNIPDEWKLIAQMPFGKPVIEPENKQFNMLEEHVKVFK